MPIDINLLREEKGGKPALVIESQKKRSADETLVPAVMAMDQEWRKSNYKMESLKMEFNAVNKEIATKKKESKGQDKCEDLVEKSKQMKKAIEDQKAETDKLETDRNNKLKLIGNIVGPDVPIFKEEDKNEVVKKWGEPTDLAVDGKTLGKLHHHQIMELLDLVELERGQKVAGHRGYYLKGNGVFLNQALI